jgi:hypothetical protein
MKSIPPDSFLKDYKKRRSTFLEELIASTPNLSVERRIGAVRNISALRPRADIGADIVEPPVSARLGHRPGYSIT